MEAVFSGIQQGASVALAAAQLRSRHDLRCLEPGFLGTTRPEAREVLVGEFAAAAEAIVAIVNVEDIIGNAHQGP